MMKAILILFIYGLGGATPSVVQTPYETSRRVRSPDGSGITGMV